MNKNLVQPQGDLFGDLCHIIEHSKTRVATAVSSGITLMYWHLGDRINKEILNNKRAEYGKQIVATLSRQLKAQYCSKEFEEKKLRRMMQFATQFPDLKAVATLSTRIHWSHVTVVLPLKDEVQREFYLTMAASERWSVRLLRERMNSMLYERTLVSGKPDEFVKQELSQLRDENILSPDLVFKSPYFLDFTGLKGFYRQPRRHAASRFTKFHSRTWQWLFICRTSEAHAH